MYSNFEYCLSQMIINVIGKLRIGSGAAPLIKLYSYPLQQRRNDFHIYIKHFRY